MGSLASALLLVLKEAATSKAARLYYARQILEAVKRRQAAQKAGKVAALIGLALLLTGCAWLKGAVKDDCTQLRVAEGLACGADPASKECAEARKLIADICQGPSIPPEKPPEEPPAPPVTPPPVTPPVTPPPAEPPTTPPPAGPYASCPKAPAAGATVFVNAKPYGQGVDSEVRIVGDLEFCQAIHGEVLPLGANCHLEGWPKRQECEAELVAAFGDGKGRCPVWQWRTAARPEAHPCVRVDPYEFDGMSCDHYGNTTDRDDPNTPAFEGLPAYCGEQKDAAGDYAAGYFTIAHGDGEVRACLPGFNGCSRFWVKVQH